MNWNIFNPRAVGPASTRSFTTSAFVRSGTETLSDIASILRNLWLDVRDSYRPELHYMRGPGPKWQAKHQRRITSVLNVSYAHTMLSNSHAVIEPTSVGGMGLVPSVASAESNATTMRFRMSRATAFTVVDEGQAFAPAFRRILQSTWDS